MPNRDRAVDAGIVVVLASLTILTIVVVVNPDVAPAVVNAPLDVLIGSAGTLVALAVAILGWIQFREAQDDAALLRASAFGVLAVHGALLLAVAVGGAEEASGLSLAEPGQFPLWGVILARGLSTTLLVLAGVAALRRWQPQPRDAILVLAVPALLMVAAFILGVALQDSLPMLLDDAALASLAGNPTVPPEPTSGSAMAALQSLIGIGYLAAASLAYRVYYRDRRGADGFLSIGLAVAAFSQVHSAIHPGSYLSLVTTGDLLRVVFYALILLSLVAESRGVLRALRNANAQLRRLRDAEVARATVEERARLAREIHDGMSQELWFAKLKQNRLMGLPDLTDNARALGEEVAEAIESALGEARQAIVALRPTEGASFTQVLERFVEDFADRFGIPAECRCAVAVEQLPARLQAELLRIVGEALTNSRKHADPTRVSVEAATVDGRLRLTVTDNGRGFDPAVVESGGYGLRSMRERAAIIGGSMRIDTGHQDGTRVVVEVPLSEAAG